MSTLNAPPPFVERLIHALDAQLKDVGIEAKIDSEPVGGTTKLYRIHVIAGGFEPLGHSERQGLVWRIADRTLSPAEQIKISMILTLTPAECEPNGG
jgi:hypothetical protein